MPSPSPPTDHPGEFSFEVGAAALSFSVAAFVADHAAARAPAAKMQHRLILRRE
jgi:hypothetical protein